MMIRRHTRFAAIVAAHLRQLKGTISLATLAALGSAAMALLAPWPLKLIYDHILLEKAVPGSLLPVAGLLHGGSVAGLAVLSLPLVIIVLSAGVFSYYQLFLTSRIGNQLVCTLLVLKDG